MARPTSDDDFTSNVDVDVDVDVDDDDEDDDEAVDATATPMILEHDVAHRTLMTLLQREAEKDDEPSFARAFGDVVSGNLDKWVGQGANSNRGALVLEALLRAKSAQNAKTELQKQKPALKKLAAAGNKGADALLKKLNAK